MLRGARNLTDAPASAAPIAGRESISGVSSGSARGDGPPAPAADPARGERRSPDSGAPSRAGVATELEPDLAEPPEIDFDAPGPPRITGRAPSRPQAPPEPLSPPEPQDGEIEIRPLTAELGIHPESIPPPGGDEAPPEGPEDRESPRPAARWTSFAASLDERDEEIDPAGTDLPTDPSLRAEPDAAAGTNAPPEPGDPPEPPFVLPRRAPAGVADDWTLIPPPGSRAPTAIAAGMLFLGGLGIGIATTLLATEGDGTQAPAQPAAKATPPRHAAVTTGAPVPLLPRAFAIDPYGGDGEHQDQARLAVDGDPATAWTTQRYATGSLGKPGVGLAVTAARPAAARRITIRTPTPGFRAAIYGAGGGRPVPGSPRSGWVRVAGVSTVRSGVPIRLTASAPMRHWLVWIVALAPGRKSAEIAEIGLRR